jgi:hypothetical protein
MQSGGCRSQPAGSCYLPCPTQSKPLPLPVQDGEMLRRQFYFALAVNERASQVQRVTRRVAAAKEALLRSTRKGARPCPAMPSIIASTLLLLQSRTRLGIVWVEHLAARR